MNINKQYKNLVEKVYKEGFSYEDPNRKGVIRKQISDYTFEHNFEDGYPAIGLKQTYPKMAFNEMLAFMRGYTNLSQLESLGVTFWRDDAFNYYKSKFNDTVSFEEFMNLTNTLHWTFDDDMCYYAYGDLGKIYSHQIRSWNGALDQLDQVLERLKRTPTATKNIVTMWNPTDLEDCALSPCHTLFSFVTVPLSSYDREKLLLPEHYAYYHSKVKNSEKDEYFDSLNIPKYGLKVLWDQFSCDLGLGIPVNIMYYADVCLVFAHYLNMKPIGIKGNLANVHLYDNSFNAVEEMLKRDLTEIDYPVEVELNLPKEWLCLDDYLDQLKYGESIKLKNYKHLGRLDIKMLAYSK